MVRNIIVGVVQWLRESVCESANTTHDSCTVTLHLASRGSMLNYIGMMDWTRMT